MLDEPANQCDLRLSGGDHPGCQGLANAGLRAIDAAFSMQFTDAEDCFRWLYDYGAEPLTPALARAPDAAGLVFSDALRASLSCRFQYRAQGNWHSWSLPDLYAPPVWKVYLSPTFDMLRRFELVIGPHLFSPNVAAFKTVSQRWMALRPDKIMVYFLTAEARAHWLADLRPLFQGFASNPVPFTRAFDAGGMATLATDPRDLPGQSWRSTVLRSIARKIVTPEVTCRDALCERLVCEGIDPQRWELVNGE